MCRNVSSQEVMVMDWIVGGIDAVIGMDTISRLGGVKVQEIPIMLMIFIIFGG